MKFVLSLLAFSLLVWQSSASVPAFTIDREYIYDYGMRMSSGIAGNGMQFTGIGSKCQLVIQNQGKYLYMKLRDCTYSEFNREMHYEDLYEEFQMEYHPLPEDLKDKVAITLYPIRFTMDRGMIESFDSLPEDTVWSVNIKKAILTAFQLNLERINRVRFSKSNYLKPETDLDFYRVMEDGIGGECETVYQINTEPYYKFPYERVLNVTKLRSFDRCTHRPFYSHSTITGTKCEGCNTVDPLHTTSTTEYNLRGDRRYYTIENIKTVASYVFTPNINGQPVLIGINRTIHLEETTTIKEPITFPEEFVSYNSLAYNFTYKTPYNGDDLDKPNFFPISYKIVKNQEELEMKFMDILKRLAQDHDVSIDLEREHIPQDILFLIQALTTMNFEEIKQIYYKLNKESTLSKQKELMRRYFIQVLPLVGTNPTVKAILTLAEKDLVTPKEVLGLFSALPIYVKQPSKALVEYFHDILVKFDKVDTKKPVFAAIWLSFASLLHKGCDERTGYYDTPTYHGYEYKRYISSETCRKYNKEIYDMFLKATTVHEQITFVKALGNVKLEETFTYLKPIVTGEVKYPFIVRKYASAALIDMVTVLREEVLSLAVPIYNNHTETPFMRIMAFEMIMASKPKYIGLMNIGAHLKSDPSQQVASYVYSTFVAIANNTDPCYEKLSKDLKVVLSLIPEVYYGYDYSRKVMFNYYNDKYGFGANTVWAWVGSNDSFIPENVYFRKTSNLFGKTFDLLELNFYTHGFNRLYEKVFGPDGLFSPMNSKKSAFNLFRRAPRQVDPIEKELAEIDEAIKFTPRMYEDMEAALSLKMFGQDITFSYWDDVFFNNFMKNGYFYMPRDLPNYLKTNGLEFDFHKLGLEADVHFEIPTEVGIPLFIDMKMPSYTEFTGNVKVDVLPGFYPEDREFKKPTHIKIDTDLHPLYTARSMLTFGFLVGDRKFVTGKDTEVDIHFPIVTKLDYDFSLKKLNFKYIPTKTPYEMIHVHTLPYTKASDYYKFDKTEVKDVKVINYVDRNYLEKDFKFGQNYFGVGFHVHIEAPVMWQDMRTFLRTFAVFTAKKSYSYGVDNYYTYWFQRLRNGLEHMTDYFVINPKYRRYDFKLMFEPHPTYPTTEFEFEMDFDFFAFKKAFFTEDVKLDLASLPVDKKTVVLHMDLVGRGKVERKWTGNLNVAMVWQGGRSRKVSFDFERSPIPDYDPNPLKLCYRSTTKYPSYTDFYSIDDEELKAEMHYDVSFGKDCNEKAININMLAERTSQQKYLLEHPNEYFLKLKTVCAEHNRQGYNFSEECWELFLEHYNLRKYTIDVEYENLPPRFMNMTTRFGNWLRHMFYDNMEYNFIGVDNPEKHIKIVANFSSYDSFVDVKVYKPHEKFYFKRIYYPYVFPTFQVANTRINYLELYTNRFFDYDHKPMCFVQGKEHFYTFDFKKYEFPISKCYHILFRDCTPEEKFTVLVKAIEHETYTKVLKVFLGKHKVEILPIGENPSTAPLVVRVDGSKKSVTSTTPFLFTDPENDDRILFVVRKFNNWFFLKSKVYGFEIFFNGDMINSEVSVFHRGHLCGLCGEYNGETHNEFTGPDGCVYHDEKMFGYSYAIPDETCDIPVFKDRECVLPHAPKYPGKCYYYRNKVVYDVVPDRMGRRSSNVCFSRLPIPHCSEGCKPTNYVKTKVGFHCLNARDAFTERMIRQSKDEELVNIQNKSEDYYEEVEYPEACVKV